MQISDIDNGIKVTTGNISILRGYVLKRLGVKNHAVCNLLSNGSESFTSHTYVRLNRNLDAALRKIFLWLLWVLVAACGILSCGVWDLAPWLGIKPRPPALGAWSLNHWNTREVLVFFGGRGLLDLYCCKNLSLVVVRAFLCGGFSCSKHRLNSYGLQPESLQGMWDPPRPGIELVLPSLAGGFFITEPAKPLYAIFSLFCFPT